MINFGSRLKNKKSIIKPYAALFVFGLFFVFSLTLFGGIDSALAQSSDTFGLATVDNSIELVNSDIRVIIAKIIRVVLSLLGAIAVSIVLYGGFVYMTAGGSEEKVSQAKKILMNAGIGLAIILSSWSITQFVIGRLSDAIRGSGGVGQTDGAQGKPDFQNYSGSGALGRIVKDHYPDRDQINLPRNTKIAVTFREGLDPKSFIDNTNNTCWGAGDTAVACPGVNNQPYLGDCFTANGKTVCDALKTNAIVLTKKDDSEKLDATVSAVYKNKELFTFSLSPVNLLGTEKEEFWYNVNLTNKVNKANGDSAFSNQPGGRYQWEFKTSVNADFTPPTISEVYPKPGSTISRNTIVQIHFSESVDPTVAQGFLKDGGAFSNLVFHNKSISGEWKLSNEYRTAEFIPDSACGQNSCGETMYCLPMTCEGGGSACGSTGYTVLARTAELKDPSKKESFEGKAFTGILDMSGNALDGNEDGKPNGKPSSKDKYQIDPAEKKADNADWAFVVKNNIDLTVPYVTKVTPALDGTFVQPKAPVTLSFSHAMMVDSFYDNIAIQESPQAKDVDQIWYKATAKLIDGKTQARIKHRDFGPNGEDLFYYVAIASDAKAVNQNCLYPGRGPYSNKRGESPVCSYDQKTKKGTNCIDVTAESATDTGCALTDGVKNEHKQSNIGDCIKLLESKIPKLN
jgi:hypothetical protein